jgi:hypothetical protein
MDLNKIHDIIDSIKDIQKSVIKKGYNQWYSRNGQLIINGNNAQTTKNKLIAIIKKNKNQYMNKKIYHTQIVFHYEPDIFLNEDLGAFEIQSSIYEVKEVLGKISLQIVDNEGAFVRVFYDINDIYKFKLTHPKQVGLLALAGKLRTTITKYYHYQDLKYFLS